MSATTARLFPPTPANAVLERLEAGGALLLDTPDNLLEVVHILDSYGVVLDAYSRNLCYIAENEFLVLFPFFKYFNGQVTPAKLWQHWVHDRINFEYAEYCMKAMFWHGGGGLDTFLDGPEFRELADRAIRARWRSNPVMLGLHQLFPDFWPELIRQSAYYSALGQFWRVMSDMFASLAARYAAGEIRKVPDVATHVRDGLVAAAAIPITYSVEIDGDRYDILPASAGLTFLADTAIPYVEAVFFRGTPFPGTVSYNAQAHQIPDEQNQFAYGALFADPLPIGGAGIPPTQLMQDMVHYLPPELQEFYAHRTRGSRDVRVKICESFQKSMFCVTTGALMGLAPHPLTTQVPEQQLANRQFLQPWLDRISTTRLSRVNALC